MEVFVLSLQPWVLSALDLLGLLSGTAGAFLLAKAFGPLDPRGPVQVRMGGKPAVVVQRLEFFTWGVRLIGAAFLLQLPRVVLALTHAF